MSAALKDKLDLARLKKQIREKLRPKLAQLNAQPRRIRLFGPAIVVLLLYAALDWSVLQPNGLHREEVEDRIEKANGAIHSLSDQKHKIEARRDLDPDKELKEERDRLSERIAQLDQQLKSLTVGLISPTEMARMLEDMLGEVTDLELRALKTLPAEPVVERVVDDAPGVESTGGRYYRHGIEMELSGGYFSTLRYLELLEDLPWDFFWDELAYQVEEYPQARVRLRIHTLSTKQEWIGV